MTQSLNLESSSGVLGTTQKRAATAQAGNSWRLLFSRGYRAELLVGASVAFFSQINGVSGL